MLINIISGFLLGSARGTASSGPPDSNLKVYLFGISQSNMGSGDNTSLPAYQGTKNAWIYNPITEVIERMNIGVNTDPQGYPTVAQYPTGFGPETVSGINLSAIATDKVLIIKYLAIGTGMTGSSPNWTIADNTLYPLNKAIVLDALAAAETHFSLSKSQIEIKGVIRMQGEADADNSIDSGPVVQAAWKAGHTLATNDLLTSIATAGYVVNTCRLVTGRIRTWTPARPRQVEVRAAIVDFADNYPTDNPLMTNYVAGSTWIDNDALTTTGDTHYDPASNIVFGQDVSDDLTPYIYEVFVPTTQIFEDGDDYIFESGETLQYENR